MLWLSAAIALETAIYSAITPLLPYYAHRLGLGKTALGLPAGSIGTKV